MSEFFRKTESVAGAAKESGHGFSFVGRNVKCSFGTRWKKKNGGSNGRLAERIVSLLFFCQRGVSIRR